jgi:uncharacterized protein YfaP (DUF2135 family)
VFDLRSTDCLHPPLNRSVRRHMQRFLVSIALLALPAAVFADVSSDFNAALARWKASGISSYTFTYKLGGADLIAPWCAGADIQVRVIRGVGRVPVVTRGGKHCAVGTSGKRIGFDVPRTIDAAFEIMRRYIFTPPTPAEVKATYDPQYGFPTSYYVTKTEISVSVRSWTHSLS